MTPGIGKIVLEKGLFKKADICINLMTNYHSNRVH